MSNPTYEELQAQVEVLKQYNASLRELCDEIIDHLRYNKAERSEVLDDFWGKLSAIGCAESPAACLAQVRAESFKAGFFKAKSVYKCELGQCKTDLEEWAAEYAESIQQEVK